MKILYIEDNAELSVLVVNLLRGHQFEVEHFALGQPALDRFRESASIWDAALIDLELPDIPGESLLPHIAAYRPGLPIVIYSGAQGVKDQLGLYGLGAAAVVAKPCGAQDLLDVLKGLIESPPQPIQ